MPAHTEEQRPLPDTVFAHLNVSKSLVGSFFIVFARFEFALKEGGFAQGNDTQVSAQWDAFARDLNTAFERHLDAAMYHKLDTSTDRRRNLKLTQAVEYFNQHPPKKQIVQDGRLGWREPVRRPNEALLPWLLMLVRRVRNNLFHGGKFLSAVVPEPARNKLLLQHSLVILYECLALAEHEQPDVWRAFFGYLE